MGVLGTYHIFVDVTVEPNSPLVGDAIAELKKNGIEAEALLTTEEMKEIWFPRRMADLDHFAERVMAYGAELDAGEETIPRPLALILLTFLQIIPDSRTRSTVSVVAKSPSWPRNIARVWRCLILSTPRPSWRRK